MVTRRQTDRKEKKMYSALRHVMYYFRYPGLIQLYPTTRGYFSKQASRQPDYAPPVYYLDLRMRNMNDAYNFSAGGCITGNTSVSNRVPSTCLPLTSSPPPHFRRRILLQQKNSTHTEKSKLQYENRALDSLPCSQPRQIMKNSA